MDQPVHIPISSPTPLAIAGNHAVSFVRLMRGCVKTDSDVVWVLGDAGTTCAYRDTPPTVPDFASGGHI